MKGGALPPCDLPRGRWKIIGFMLLCLPLGAGGVLMLRDGQEFGWLVAGFFGLGIAAFALLLFGPYGVTVDSQGFSVRTLFSEKRYFWTQVSPFSLYRIHGSSMIIFDDGDEGLMAKVNRGIIGPSAAIPAILIGGSLEEACALLNRYRLNATGVSA